MPEILFYGSKVNQVNRVGIVLGAKADLVGILSVQLWEKNTLEILLIFTVVEKT